MKYFAERYGMTVLILALLATPFVCSEAAKPIESCKIGGRYITIRYDSHHRVFIPISKVVKIKEYHGKVTIIVRVGESLINRYYGIDKCEFVK